MLVEKKYRNNLQNLVYIYIHNTNQPCYMRVEIKAFHTEKDSLYSD